MHTRQPLVRGAAAKLAAPRVAARTVAATTAAGWWVAVLSEVVGWVMAAVVEGPTAGGRWGVAEEAAHMGAAVTEPAAGAVAAAADTVVVVVAEAGNEEAEAV